MTSPDGIYFNMSFEDYLDEPRLHASQLNDLIEGPAAFWAKSWLNPARKERATTPAMIHGAAWHCARLEPERFQERYVRQIVPEDLGPDTLTTDAAVKARLKEIGETQVKAGESAIERAARLRDTDPNAPPIWSLTLAEWENTEAAGRQPLAQDVWDAIMADSRFLRMVPEAAELLNEGAAEVSIFWTEHETGIKCKCRPDWLRSDGIVHFKTWESKSFGKPGNDAVRDAFQWNGYYRDAWFYQMALELVRSGDLPIQGKPSQSQHDLIQTIRTSTDRLRCWYLFQRRGVGPDIRRREVLWHNLPPAVEEQSIGAATDNFKLTPNALQMKARAEVMSCLRMYQRCTEIYREDEAWFPLDTSGTFEDADFSPWWLDSIRESR